MNSLDIRRAQAELYGAVVTDVVIGSPDLESLFIKYAHLLDEEIVVGTNIACSCHVFLEKHPLNPVDGQTEKLETVEEFIRRGNCTCGYESPGGVRHCRGSVRLVHAAAGYGNLKALQLLAENNCDFNAKTSYHGLTPLMYAVRNHIAPQMEIIDFLLSHKADVNITCNPDNETPLMFAVNMRRTYIVERLLKVPGINVNHQCRKQKTALMLSVSNDVEDAFQLLMTSNADPNITNARGNGAIIEAVFRDSTYIETLVKHGANVNMQNKRGDTPLLLALQMDDEAKVQFLLENKADPNLDARDNPLLILAAIMGSESSATALIKHGVDVNKTNLQGYNALHVAAWNGQVNVVNMLLKAGIQPDARTGDKNTALALACHGNFANVLDILIPLGCNVNNSDKDSDTPLHYTTYNGNTEMTQTLLDHGADPNAVSDLQVTPLWNAVYKKKKDIVKLLLARNVEMEVKGRGSNQHSNSDLAVPIYSEPRSPLYVAADRNSTEIALLLVSAGYDIFHEGWLLAGEFPLEL